MCAVNLYPSLAVEADICLATIGEGEAQRGQTFIIASRTLELLIRSARNKFSTSSLLLDPEHRHAMVRCFAVPLKER
jgi:hypothetical protein